MNDKMKIRVGRVVLDYGLDEEGDPCYNTHLEGDMRYVETLGLLNAAMIDLPGMFDLTGHDYDDDEWVDEDE